MYQRRPFVQRPCCRLSLGNLRRCLHRGPGLQLISPSHYLFRCAFCIAFCLLFVFCHWQLRFVTLVFFHVIIVCWYNCLPEGGRVLLLSALRRSGHLAAYCGLFPVGDPRKRFPDDVSLCLSAILEHHSRGDGILPPKATKVSESRGENRKINTSNKISSLRVIFRSGWSGRDA